MEEKEPALVPLEEDRQEEDLGVDDIYNKNVPYKTRLKEVLKEFWSLGITSFGGPQAHVSYLLEKFVVKKKWLDEQMFSELFGLGQGLPGPTSTQMVYAVAVARAGLLGGLLAFFMWCLPGYIFMLTAGYLYRYLPTEAIWLQTIERSLASAAIGLIAIAAWKLGSKVVNSHVTFCLMIAGASISMLYESSWLFPVMMVCGGLTTLIEWKIKEWRRKKTKEAPPPETPIVNNKFNVVGINRPTAYVAIAIFLLLAGILLIGKYFIKWNYFVWTEIFFRMGSLIFGGGQVVIPMLLTELVDKGFIAERDFLNGFALAQALPGPMFNLAVYLGAVMGGFGGALLCWFGLFAPGILLITGFYPFWIKYRSQKYFKIALDGVNSTAIGLIIAAVFLLWFRAVKNDAFMACITLLSAACTGRWNVSAPIVVIASGFLGAIRYGFSLL